MKKLMTSRNLMTSILCFLLAFTLLAGSFAFGETDDEVIIEDEITDDVEDTEPGGDEPVDEPEEDPTEEPADPTEEPTEVPTEEPTEVPAEEPTVEPTEEPVQPTDAPTPVIMSDLFKIVIKVPQDWTNAKSKAVRIKVKPLTGETWARVQYKMDDGNWIEIKDKFTLLDDYYYVDVEITTNGIMTVRLNNADGVFMDEKKEIKIFDRTAPTVTAGFNDRLLHVEAPDDLSGAAGVQVNGLLFTTLENGKLDVRMEDVLLTYKQLAIRAYDYAGNFSEMVTLDNPYYAEPTATPKPTKKPTTKPTQAVATATPKPTRKPSTQSSTETEDPDPTREPVAVTTPEPVQSEQPVSQQPVIIYVTQEPQPTPEPVIQTEYVPIGPGQPYTSNGNMQTLDVLYSAATNKQFITVQSRAGQTYYLVIDYDKPIDEENEIYETYFLNLVDDRDLMSVLTEEEIVPTPTPEIIYVTPEPTTPPAPTAEPVVEPEKKKDNSSSMMMLLLIAVIGGGVAIWFFKFRNKGTPKSAPVREFDDDDEIYGSDGEEPESEEEKE